MGQSEAKVEMTPPIRVLVVDDHAVVREGVAALLRAEPDVEVVGEAADGETGVQLAAELAPDVVVMDIGLPDLTGIEATRRLRALRPGIRVLALTVYEKDEYLEEMLRAGAAGYVLKKAAARDLVAAIRRVHRGEVALDPEMATGYVLRRSLESASPAPPPAPPRTSLSEREREVLRLIAEGYTNREIGRQLEISEKTVQTHRANIMSKLRVHNTAELLKEARRLGLL